MKILTAAEMRAADAATVEAGTPVETLMERAGAGAVAAIERRYGSVRGYRVHVVCGKGNNGGDGFVVARLLARKGAHVEVRPLERSLQADAQTAFDKLAGVQVVDRPPARDADFVVDAVLGTGSRGPVPASYFAALKDAVAPSTRVIAIDLPTGVDADTGRPCDGVVPADLTVTFAHLKPAHVLYPGRTLCGTIEVVDIGVESVDGLELATDALVAALLPRRAPTAHKGSAGRVLVVGGSAGMTGSIVLAASSALRAGAGYVTCALPESVDDAIAPALIEAVRWPLPEAPERSLGMNAAPMIVARAREVQALALGPGLSRAPESAELARRVVAESPATVVLDADGLNAFAGKAELFRRRKSALVLTPHLGELSRLTGFAPAELEEQRLEIARRFAEEWDVVLVMKGAPTVVAAPDGRATVNPTGNPGMATMGMGDVLTGVVAAFIAQGLAPYDAARAGVYVHGLAADLFGKSGLVAGDVTAALPQALDRLIRAGKRSEVAVPLPQSRIAPAPDGIPGA